MPSGADPDGRIGQAASGHEVEPFRAGPPGRRLIRFDRIRKPRIEILRVLGDARQVVGLRIRPRRDRCPIRRDVDRPPAQRSRRIVKFAKLGMAIRPVAPVCWLLGRGRCASGDRRAADADEKGQRCRTLHVRPPIIRLDPGSRSLRCTGAAIPSAAELPPGGRDRAPRLSPSSLPRGHPGGINASEDKRFRRPR